MDITFRKLNEKDKDLFIQLRMEYITETFNNVNETIIKELNNNLSKYFDEHINKKDFIGIIGEYNGIVVSAAYLTISEIPPNPSRINGKSGTLLNVYTFPEYRKKGIGSKLIKEIINEAKLLGIASIELKATKDGYNLYKNIGFTEVTEDNEYTNMSINIE